MKKIVIIMLVAMVPYFTMAQKRSKKNKKVETVVKNNASYEFMVITGYEIMINNADKRIKGGPDQIPPPDVQLKMIMQSNSKVRIQFDFGGNDSDENILLSENRYKSMSHAVNGAANNGWEFVSSDIIISGTVKTHYYYMRKTK